MYEELVNRLREHGEFLIASDKTKAPPNVNVRNVFAEDYYQAADAIEKLRKYANTIMRLKSEGWYLQQIKNHDGYAAIVTMPLPEPPKEE